MGGRGRGHGVGAFVDPLLLQSVSLSPSPASLCDPGGQGWPWQCFLCLQCLDQGLAQSKSVVELRKQSWVPVTPLPSAVFSRGLPSALKISDVILLWREPSRHPEQRMTRGLVCFSRERHDRRAGDLHVLSSSIHQWTLIKKSNCLSVWKWGRRTSVTTVRSGRGI